MAYHSALAVDSGRKNQTKKNMCTCCIDHLQRKSLGLRPCAGFLAALAPPLASLPRFGPAGPCPPPFFAPPDASL
eukprot:3156999-Rhodomonas_salina.1